MSPIIASDTYTEHVYIHIPFCEAKCPYCSFVSMKVSNSVKEIYIRQLLSEIRVFFDVQSGKPLKSVYFGGGTPSTLTIKQLERIISSLKTKPGFSQTAEVTVECHPAHITEGFLKQLNLLGVTRLSVGVQSFLEHEILFLKRPYTIAFLLKKLDLLFSVKGSMQIGFDLIIGLPDQTIEAIEKNLKKLCSYNPDHCSCYLLSIEEKTKFGLLKNKKKLLELEEEQARTLYLYAHQFLEEKGYEHYEISNWAKAGAYCQHNKAIWKGEAYKGFGLGAHSYYSKAHRFQTVHLSEYLEGKRNEDVYPCKTKEELLSVSLLGITRTLAGIPRSLCAGNEALLQSLCAQGYLVEQKDRYVSTPEGWLVNDAVVGMLYEKFSESL